MKGIFVDLDGVLWFSESTHKDAFKNALCDILNNASELIDQTWEFGESTEKYLERLLTLGNVNFSESEIAELAARKRKFAAGIAYVPLNNLLIQSLHEIKDEGALISLVSSSSPSNVQKFLNNSNLHNFFDCVVDSSMVTSPKPDPSCYSLAMRNLGLSPHNCIVIEDSEAGKVAAKRAGIAQIFIFPTDFPDQQYTPTLRNFLSSVI
jgi:beta-phosphoglucomutase-like phosphatase (HAD superfamily)